MRREFKSGEDSMSASAWLAIPPGTITDTDIILLADQGELITSGFDTHCVKQACYELRASSVFFDPASPLENKRIEIDATNYYLLRPNCSVVSIVEESLRLPGNVLAGC
jgi:hypothetical protein